MKHLGKTLVIISLFSMHSVAYPEEGMWIPVLLHHNIEQMQRMGFQLTVEDIYSINQSSLKDAIVRFGRGCTGEVVSPDGLLLTNHHCGFGMIHRHSSLERDLLTNGYWAQSLSEELPNPGLTVTFLVRMEEVTDQVLDGIKPGLTEEQREALIRKNSSRITKEATRDTHLEAEVRSFYHGNQYYLLVTEVFKDVRLVGAPPSRIGNFGGDTDNWVWPRHTGDFSVFRIYADTNNQPAEYAETNVPYQPKHYLPISLEGYDEGDFTLLFGNPGTTREYLTSFAIETIAFRENPVKIRLRQRRLEIIGTAMAKSHLVRIQYASKHFGIANYWKKMIGETQGIRRSGAVERKQEFEREFQQWAVSHAGDQPGYPLILPMFEKLYLEAYPIDMASVYLKEAGMAPEITRFSLSASELIRLTRDKTTTNEELTRAGNKLMETARSFYKNYQPEIDQLITEAMLQEMKDNMNPKYLPDIFEFIRNKYQGNINQYVTELFNTSIFADSIAFYERLRSFKRKDARKMVADPAFQLARSIYTQLTENVDPASQQIHKKIDSLQRIYMQAQIQMQPGKHFYPDANSTMRVSYGQVSGFNPADAVSYSYYTTVHGILGKEDSTIYDYVVDDRFKQLISAGDFGRYADKDGSLHVAFISTVHSTGGNSGAPVLNAKGELVGINFDRNWEGTMSDLSYDPKRCRNIILDIRYLLFIMDLYAGAKHLVEEMDIR